MFEHRLGLALGKTIGEIRAMPASEFMRWQLFSIAEPFDWHNDEYRTGVILAMLYNANRGKGKARNAEDFMRDIAKGIENATDQVETEIKVDEMSEEERRKFLLARIKKDFGIRK
jgi:hypothetical protein